jgi:hypothetical protein
MGFSSFRSADWSRLLGRHRQHDPHQGPGGGLHVAQLKAEPGSDHVRRSREPGFGHQPPVHGGHPGHRSDRQHGRPRRDAGQARPRRARPEPVRQEADQRRRTSCASGSATPRPGIGTLPDDPVRGRLRRADAADRGHLPRGRRRRQRRRELHPAVARGGDEDPIDCFEKRGKKGYLFTVGDEPPLPFIGRESAKRVLGIDLQADMSSQDALALVERQYEVFHLIVAEGSDARRSVPTTCDGNGTSCSVSGPCGSTNTPGWARSSSRPSSSTRARTAIACSGRGTAAPRDRGGSDQGSGRPAGRQRGSGRALTDEGKAGRPAFLSTRPR